MPFLRQLTTRGNPFESPSVPLASLANAPGWFQSWASGGPTESGESVTPLTALQVTAVVACVRLIAEGVGQLPLHIIERLVRGQRVASGHPLFDLLASEWNPEMTATVAMQVTLVHALLWGTSYTEIQRDTGNRVVALWPRKPSHTEPKRDKNGALVYVTTDTKDGSTRTIAAADMLCVPGLSLDGWVGQATTQYARQVIGLAMALDKHAARYFGNGISTTGTVEVPGELTDVAFRRMQESIEKQTSGANRFRALILEGGTKFNNISSPNDQGQFIESRRAVTASICSLFRVPIYLISSDESKGVKSNTEQISQDFLTFTLQPWLVKYQQEFDRKLFPKLSPLMGSTGRFEVQFYTKSLMAADSASRMAYYVNGRNSGILTANECRMQEGLEPVGPEGDLLMVPLNTIPATKLLEEGGDPEDAPADEARLLPRLITQYSPLFEDGFSRLQHRAKRDSASIRQCLNPALVTVSNSLRDMLATTARIDVGSVETDKAIEKYLAGLDHRAETPDVAAEVTRILKSMTYAAYRDLAATQAAKAIQESNEETP